MISRLAPKLSAAASGLLSLAGAKFAGAMELNLGLPFHDDVTLAIKTLIQAYDTAQMVDPKFSPSRIFAKRYATRQ